MPHQHRHAHAANNRQWRHNPHSTAIKRCSPCRPRRAWRAWRAVSPRELQCELHSAEYGAGAVAYCDRIGFEASLPVIAVQIRDHDNGRRSCCRRAEKSRLLAMVGVVAARRRRRPTRMTPQRCGCCKRGGEERQERRASKMNVTAGIHQVVITILHRALRLGNGCTCG